MTEPLDLIERGDEVTYEFDDGVVVITINRPGNANSLNRIVRAGLYRVWERFENDPQARVAILTGAGDRVFCAGADLSEMAADGLGEPPPDWAPVLGDNFHVSKPTIAAVNGAAVGGGFLQAQMCDLAIAATNARFGISEARWGRGSPWALPLFSMIPTRAIMELLLTAIPMTAQRAYEVGLVNRVVEPAELMPTAMMMARAIAENAPLSLSAAKQMAHIARTATDVAEAKQRTREVYARVYSSRDAQIGPMAFQERVKPAWTGS
jgi:enoyl-CoA hydratase/carnithine racemase